MSVYYVSRDKTEPTVVTFWQMEPGRDSRQWWSGSEEGAGHWLGQMTAGGFEFIYGWSPNLLTDKGIGELWRVDGDERERLRPEAKKEEPAGDEPDNEIVDVYRKIRCLARRLSVLEKKLNYVLLAAKYCGNYRKETE